MLRHHRDSRRDGRRGLSGAMLSPVFLAGLLAGVLAGEASAVDDPPANITTTTTSSSLPALGSTTSSSMLEDYENEVLFGIYPSKPISSLTVHIRAYPDYGPDDAYCVYYGRDGQVFAFHGETTLDFATYSGGLLARSQGVLICNYYTHEPHGPMDDFGVLKVIARDAGGEVVDASLCELDYSQDALAPLVPGQCREACGDALCDGGEPKASDALAILRAAVHLDSCELRICDANRDGNVTAVDAQRILRRSVGHELILLCPAPC